MVATFEFFEVTIQNGMFVSRYATMGLQVILLLILNIEWSRSQQRCPSNLGWNKFEDSCYKFEAFPRLVKNGASTVCQQDGAHLLSISSKSEHEFIKKWLLNNDIRRVKWVTSGVSRGSSVNWQGDDTTSSTLYYKENSKPTNDSRLPVIYSYTGYGLDVENARDAPRGPIFLQQPQDTAVLGANVPRVLLECLAEGNPEPSYEWVMRRNNQWVPVPLGGRYTITTGKLEISKPKDTDENSYQCRASNEVGTTISTSAQLSFGFLGDFSPVASARVSGAEYSGAQIECPAIVGKPAKTYQWYKDSVMFFIRPNFQKHIFMSMNGKLYFSELNTSDKGTYYCVVNLFAYGFGDNILSVSSDSKTSRGFDLEVTSGGGRFFQPEIQNQFPFVFPTNPVKGGDVRIECFAYGTGPLIYTWSRPDNKPLPLGHWFESDNRILYLTQVKLEDSGPYKCHVLSRTTSQEDEATTNLIVQARPYFTYPLAHMHLDVGSRLAWHCEAAGMPSPVYTWYKNGDLFTGDASAGIVVERNSLTIEKVEVQRDSGMYQCAATNQYGTTYSTAQLRVLKIAPTFDKRPMIKSKTAARGGDVTLICSPVAAPAPAYRWLKDGTELGLDPNDFQTEEAHYQLLRNGNLIIRKLLQGDQGRYTCVAENDGGSASDFTDLLILEGTSISDPPADEKVEVNLTATLLCRASHAPQIDMVYVWSFNDHVIDFNLEPEYRR
ncbi:contactin, partial [Elysia marginata]